MSVWFFSLIYNFLCLLLSRGLDTFKVMVSAFSYISLDSGNYKNIYAVHDDVVLSLWMFGGGLVVDSCPEISQSTLYSRPNVCCCCVLAYYYASLRSFRVVSFTGGRWFSSHSRERDTERNAQQKICLLRNQWSRYSPQRGKGPSSFSSSLFFLMMPVVFSVPHYLLLLFFSWLIHFVLSVYRVNWRL